MRRSKLEIILSVLGAVYDGEKKPTRIMYASNLSWNTGQRVLSNLVEKDLVREYTLESKKNMIKRYEITEKGVNTLNYFQRAREIIEVPDIL
jgi:predicted transcriptional regulator